MKHAVPRLTSRRLATVVSLALLACPTDPAPGQGRSVEIPEPNLALPAGPPAFEPSYVHVPIQISLGFLSDALERDVPREIDTGGEFRALGEGIEIRYRTRRDSFDISFDEEYLELGAGFSYWVEARGADFDEVACGGPSEAMTGEILCRFKFGWGEEWGLDVRFDQSPLGYRERCKPKPPGINFTKVIGDEIRKLIVGPLKETILETLKGNGAARSVVEEAWNVLRDPIDLHNYDMWLSFQPSDMVSDPIIGSGAQVSSRASIAVTPRMKIGDPPAASSAPLPNTKVRLADEELRIAFDCGVTLESLSEQIRERCAQIPDEESRIIDVAEVYVLGAANRVVVVLGIEGELEGTIYLEGAPAYDPESYVLGVRDIDYTQETKQALRGTDEDLRGALETLRSCVDVSLKSSVSQGVTTYLAQLGPALNQELSPHVSIKGGINKRRTVGPFVSEKVLGVRLLAVGNATLVVE